jgi:hypothetical protein
METKMERYQHYTATYAIPCVSCHGDTKDRMYDLEEKREIAVCNLCDKKFPFINGDSIQVKHISELPNNASVKVFIADNYQRYIRWTDSNESEDSTPKVVYDAPGWVWELYQQGLEKGKEEAEAKAAKLTQW